jgi:hypothetical protein
MFSKGRRNRELAAELEGHLQMHIDDNRRAGMAPEEARRQALIKLGGVEQTMENYRDRLGVPALEFLFQDLRYALRMLRKNPAFTVAAVLTLALGIGANAAIFTLTYAVILKSLPVPNPGQLVRYTFRQGSMDIGLSGPAYEALRRHETVNTDLLAWSDTDFAVQEKEAVTRVSGALITGSGFRVLELRPYLGRVFGDQDDVTSGGPSGFQALLGYDYWKQHFQGSQAVLGQGITVNGRMVTVIGVLPPGFDGLIAGVRADIVLPLAFEEVLHAPQPMRRHAGSFWLTVMGRLKPGESVQTAQANLRATEATVREEADPSHHFLSGFFAPFHFGVESGRTGRSLMKVVYQEPLVVLEVLVGLLLLLCCANTALLVLARISSRTREFALRSALGAPRARLFRQVLLEVGLLAVGGLGGGICLGWVGAQTLVAMLASIGEPPPLDVTPRAAIIAFTASISLLSALVAGLWPALRAVRMAPGPSLKQGGGSLIAQGAGQMDGARPSGGKRNAPVRGLTAGPIVPETAAGELGLSGRRSDACERRFARQQTDQCRCHRGRATHGRGAREHPRGGGGHRPFLSADQRCVERGALLFRWRARGGSLRHADLAGSGVSGVFRGYGYANCGRPRIHSFGRE